MPQAGSSWGGWSAFRTKKQYEEYKEVASDEEDGRISLPRTPRPDMSADDEVSASLLENGNPLLKEKKRSRFCVCWGVDLSFFWKALGVVAGLWAVYAVFTGFSFGSSSEVSASLKAPEFGKSLACQNKDFFYKDARKGFEYTVPVSEQYHDHSLKLQGGGMGTLTIKNAPEGADKVTYSIVIRGSDKTLVEGAVLETETPDSGLGVALRFNTPAIPMSETETCIRFDITMSIPSSVKTLNVHSRSLLHVKFADDQSFDLKRLSIVLFRQDENNIIFSSGSVFANAIEYEVFRGWIVGEATITKATSIVTQRGNGVVNLNVIPVAPEDPLKPETGVLQTTTGIGRTDIVYISNPTKRPIASKHYSQKGGDVYLNYKKARFSGKISLNAKRSSLSGVTSYARSIASGDVLRRAEEWTHYVGDVNGKDTMEIMSLNGWVSLDV